MVADVGQNNHPNGCYRSPTAEQIKLLFGIKATLVQCSIVLQGSVHSNCNNDLSVVLYCIVYRFFNVA